MCSQTVVKAEHDRSIGSLPSYTVRQPAKDHEKKEILRLGYANCAIICLHGFTETYSAGALMRTSMIHEATLQRSKF